MKEKPLIILTYIVLIFTGVGALAGGLPLMLDPSGEAMGFSLRLLEGTVFNNFLIPGILLFTVIGCGNLVAAIILWKKPEMSWISTMVVGTALVIWIITQVSMIGYASVLQPIFFIIGVLEFVLGFAYIKFAKIQIYRDHRLYH